MDPSNLYMKPAQNMTTRKGICLLLGGANSHVSFTKPPPKFPSNFSRPWKTGGYSLVSYEPSY